MTEPRPRRDVDLASYTTLHCGGPAAYMADCEDVAALRGALAWARQQGLPVVVLGGGSNVVVADAGWPGLVVRYLDRSFTESRVGDAVVVRAGAGLGWDALVARAVAAGLAGIECLSGIPGLVGAAPIQNIGAYGQEVAEVITAVEVLERATGELSTLAGHECAFAYRDSRFKGPWRDRFVVTAVELSLRPGGPAPLRNGELARRAAEAWPDRQPTLTELRDLVLAIRRDKSMVLDPTDPDTRSAGSFFTNPIVADRDLPRIEAVAASLGLDPGAMPRYPAAEGRTKLSAAWLIQRAGFERGQRYGGAGLSRNHVLAIVHRGGGSGAIVALAEQIQARVQEVWGVALAPEPVYVGL